MVDGKQLVVTQRCAEGVQLITMNDPQRRNALSAPMVTAIAAALTEADHDPAVRAIVLTGAGSVFCAGGDLAEMTTPASATHARASMRLGIQQLPRVLSALDTPIIAAIDGPAVGAGLDLALGCDIRFVTDRVKFSTGFVRVGLVAADGGAWLLPRLIGTQAALELLWTGEFFDADRALALGLARTITSPEDLITQAVALAVKIASGPPAAVQLIKRLVREGEVSTLGASLELAAAHAGLVAMSQEHADSVASLRSPKAAPTA